SILFSFQSSVPHRHLHSFPTRRSSDLTLYNYTARPIYQGTVQILIDKVQPKVLPIKELVDGATADFQTEYQLLRGRLLLERVVGKLELQKSPELQTGPTISPWERFQLKVLGKVPPPPVDADG